MFKEIPASEVSIKRRKLIYGVGINDSDYMTETNIDGKRMLCPFYVKWKSMLVRCYSKNYQIKRPTYKGCTVCDSWLTFSTFKKWMIKQDWQNNCLDKDIIKTDNKVYSPETCIFISAKINTLLSDNNAVRGKYLQGVHYRKDICKFIATCNYEGKRKNLGHFSTEDQASDKYKAFKSELILSIALDQKEPLKSCLTRISTEFLQ